jgi:hypothetical protein
MKIDRNNIVITTTITLHLTPRQWHLYTTMKFVELVADYLNKHIADVFNQSNSIQEAVASADRVLNSVGEFGANDSEPRQVLYSLADKFYGEKS